MRVVYFSLVHYTQILLSKPVLNGRPISHCVCVFMSSILAVEQIDNRNLDPRVSCLI